MRGYTFSERVFAAILFPLLVFAAPLSGHQLFRCAMSGTLRPTCCCERGVRIKDATKIKANCCVIERSVASTSADRIRLKPVEMNMGAFQVRSQALLDIDSAARAIPPFAPMVRQTSGPPIILLKHVRLI
jgi:hypothetical protein